MLTEKENLLRVYHGEIPEWIPVSRMGPSEPGKYPATMMMGPPLLSPQMEKGGGRDIWGVNYVPTESTGNALIPDNSEFILPLDNLKNWRDVLKAPDLNGVDWEKLVKERIESSGIDRKQTALALTMHFGYFQLLMSFMGFEDGLLALYEEPELVHELLEFLSEFYMSVADNVLDLYNPEILSIADDTAAWGASFVSDEMYREFFAPHHDKYVKRGLDRGCTISMHNCGKCESLVDLWVEMGFTEWNPAQTCNDLKAIKAKYGNKLVISGGWDGRGRLMEPDVTDEEIRQSVRDTIDAYAPGGGFCWGGGFLGALNDPEPMRKTKVVIDEATRYGRDFYKR
ncbi:MAG: veratrol--corrinoid protein metyltransferase [Oscillospiraceae bacterium]|nr:veratrol--corrinoid protein metyltransferase [Oscillospiraceae bacterium]